MDIDWSNPYNCQPINGIRGLHQLVTTGQHKPPVIQVREKSYFCNVCIQNNAIGQCENIGNGYVFEWTWTNIIRITLYEEDENDIDIHNPMYSSDYEHVYDLVVPGEFLQTCFILILICLHIYLFRVSIIFNFYICRWHLFCQCRS